MRITFDMVMRSPNFMNPCGEREISLRGRGISIIENLGCLNNQFSCINLSDNRIERFENFPRSPRLEWVILSNNEILRIQSGMSKNLKNLRVLILSNNPIGLLSELDKLRYFKKLEILNLDGCPVQTCKNYRLYVIHSIPQLMILDNDKVHDKERIAAKAKFGSIEGKEFVRAVEAQGEKMNEENYDAALSGVTLDATQKEAIKLALANASTLEETDKIEEIVRSGNTAALESHFGLKKSRNADFGKPSDISVETKSVLPENETPQVLVLAQKDLGVEITEHVKQSTISKPASSGPESLSSLPVKKLRSPRLSKRFARIETPDISVASQKQSCQGRTNKKQKSGNESELMQNNSSNSFEVSNKEEEKLAPESVVNTEWIDKLKVTQLVKELKRRSLDFKGRKAELQKRLTDAVESGK